MGPNGERLVADTATDLVQPAWPSDWSQRLANIQYRPSRPFRICPSQ
jgi:hypothetical protein